MCMRADSTSRWASRQRASRHALVAVAVILGCWLSARHAQADTFTGKVVGVADGDTITVLHDKTPVKIRLQGVDAPEKAQPFGEKAKQLTSNLVFGKEVRAEVVSKDKYGRTLAKVSYLGKLHRDPLDRSQPHQVVSTYYSLEESLLQAGLAWWFRKYSKDKKLGQIEEEARTAKRGLWSDPRPTPPWVWRHPDLVCKKDADCVFLPAVCPGCPPCKPTPRRVGNITTLKQIQNTQARVRCARPKCRPCASDKNWIEGNIACEDGRCELKAGAALAAPAAALPTASAGSGGVYHGNVKSKVLHAPGCKDYSCKRCTAEFKSVEDARKAGYRPHGACVALFEKCYTGCLKQNMARAEAWEAIEAGCRHRCERR